jgi:hypothetical protein
MQIQSDTTTNHFLFWRAVVYFPAAIWFVDFTRNHQALSWALAFFHTSSLGSQWPSKPSAELDLPQTTPGSTRFLLKFRDISGIKCLGRCVFSKSRSVRSQLWACWVPKFGTPWWPWLEFKSTRIRFYEILGSGIRFGDETLIFEETLIPDSGSQVREFASSASAWIVR